MTIKKYYYLGDDRKPIGPFSIEELSNLSVQGKINHKTLVAEDGGSAWVAWKALAPKPTVEKYYYLDENNKPVGPFPLSRLSMLATKGDIKPDTLIAKDGDTNWSAYKEFIAGNKTGKSIEKNGTSFSKLVFISCLIGAVVYIGRLGVFDGMQSGNKALLEDYVYGRVNGKVSVFDAYDGKSIGIVQFSNGVMRVSDGGTVLDENSIGQSELFDMTCYGVDKVDMLLNSRWAHALCIATQPISQPGESENGLRYQFTAMPGDVFYISTVLDLGEKFPGNRVSKNPVRAAVYGRVKF